MLGVKQVGLLWKKIMEGKAQGAWVPNPNISICRWEKSGLGNFPQSCTSTSWQTHSQGRCCPLGDMLLDLVGIPASSCGEFSGRICLKDVWTYLLMYFWENAEKHSGTPFWIAKSTCWGSMDSSLSSQIPAQGSYSETQSHKLSRGSP